jgi:hypothetical protein
MKKRTPAGRIAMKSIMYATGLILMSLNINFVIAEKFTIENLSEQIKEEMKTKRTWKEKCPVSLDRLRLLKFSYYDFDKQEHDNGEIVILDAVAESAKAIFKELYDLKFPIAKAHRIEHYDGNDEKSMEDNNTSCFNCREITAGGLPSLHSYGLAIDINPIQNPYIAPHGEKHEGLAKILPPEGLGYLNRTNIRPGMAEFEGAKGIFKKHGFTIWGGSWNDPIDWQHFQPSRAVAQLLAIMQPDDARIFFDIYITEPKLFNAVSPKNNTFVGLYQKSPAQFMELLTTESELLKMDPDEAYSRMEEMIQ